MRALLPFSESVDLHEHYALGWVDMSGVRANFVHSVDGAVTADGLSGGLQTPGDKAVFSVLRDLADVVVVGAGTAVAEDYRPIQPDARRQEIRAHYGVCPRPPVAVVSASLRLDPSARLFADRSGNSARPLVFTCASATSAVRTQLSEVADVIDCGEQQVDLDAVLTELRRRGLGRILCEGGPTLFSQLADDGLIDELCVSHSPLLVGPGPGRITAGDAWQHSRPLTLTSVLEDDGALFLRYRA